jgi:hypothetical protein
VCERDECGCNFDPFHDRVAKSVPPEAPKLGSQAAERLAWDTPAEQLFWQEFVAPI